MKAGWAPHVLGFSDRRESPDLYVRFNHLVGKYRGPQSALEEDSQEERCSIHGEHRKNTAPTVSLLASISTGGAGHHGAQGANRRLGAGHRPMLVSAQAVPVSNQSVAPCSERYSGSPRRGRYQDSPSCKTPTESRAPSPGFALSSIPGAHSTPSPRQLRSLCQYRRPLWRQVSGSEVIQIHFAVP